MNRVVFVGWFIYLYGLLFVFPSTLLADSPIPRSTSQASSITNFQASRDQFLSTLTTHLDAQQLCELLRNREDATHEKSRVYIQALFSSGQSTLPAASREAIEQAAKTLDQAAAQFHGIDLTSPLMTLTLVSYFEHSPQLILYYTTLDTETQTRTLRGLLCHDHQCEAHHFNANNIHDYDFITIIKLASQYHENHDKKTPSSSDKVELAGLYLEKTSDWFGQPEIEVTVHFFNDDNFIEDITLSLPWAVQQGFNENTNNVPFFTWPSSATKAIAVIKEDDSDAAYYVTAKKISHVVKGLGKIGLKIGEFTDTLIEKIHHWLGEYDYIGTATFERHQPENKTIATEKEAAIFYLR